METKVRDNNLEEVRSNTFASWDFIYNNDTPRGCIQMAWNMNRVRVNFIEKKSKVSIVRLR